MYMPLPFSLKRICKDHGVPAAAFLLAATIAAAKGDGVSLDDNFQGFCEFSKMFVPTKPLSFSPPVRGVCPVP